MRFYLNLRLYLHKDLYPNHLSYDTSTQFFKISRPEYYLPNQRGKTVILYSHTFETSHPPLPFLLLFDTYTLTELRTTNSLLPGRPVEGYPCLSTNVTKCRRFILYLGFLKRTKIFPFLWVCRLKTSKSMRMVYCRPKT